MGRGDGISGRGEAKRLRGCDRAASTARRPQAPERARGAEKPRAAHQASHHDYAQRRVVEHRAGHEHDGLVVLAASPHGRPRIDVIPNTRLTL